MLAYYISDYYEGDSETIQTLNLSWNHLRRKGAEAIAEGMKVCIKELNLKLPFHSAMSVTYTGWV